MHEDVYNSNTSMFFFSLGATVRYAQMDFD